MRAFERFNRWFLGAAVVGAITMAAGCSSGDEHNAGGEDAGTTPDGGGQPDGGQGDGGSDAGARPDPVFLEPSTYADLVTIDPSFPFGVTQRRAADDAILGSHWGRHGGPMVTTGVYGGAGGPKVVQWDVSGAPTAAAVREELGFATATGLPTPFYYGADGMVDLPFGSLSLLSYTGTGAAYPGEALFYSATYDEITSRANVNGFYSGAGVVATGGPFLVFSALSPLSSSTSATNDNGLWAAQICSDALVSPPPCAASWQLVAWNGMSGPVIGDNHGNIFVGASLSSGATSDAVFGLTAAQIVPGATASAATLAEVDSGGTSSLAAIAPEGSAPGWVLGLGYELSNGVYAASYTELSGNLAAGSGVVENAITPATGVDGISVFADPEGDLWLAITKGSDGAYLELRRSTP